MFIMPHVLGPTQAWGRVLRESDEWSQPAGSLWRAVVNSLRSSGTHGHSRSVCVGYIAGVRR